VVKKSKRGKAFYGCSEYPKCDTVFWDKPIAEPCPVCNAPFTLEKTTKKEGTVRYCAQEGCTYREGQDAPSTPAKPTPSLDRRVAS
jgi:DNA topoisomerase-1